MKQIDDHVYETRVQLGPLFISRLLDTREDTKYRRANVSFQLERIHAFSYIVYFEGEQEIIVYLRLGRFTIRAEINDRPYS